MDWIKAIDKTWTLFLDRDGVINREITGGYVLTPSQFEFFPDVPIAISKLSRKFSKIIVVTNQRCVGKGLLSEKTLGEIHNLMLQEISHKMGRIERVYFCADVDDNSEFRKPQIGMALQAKKDYPEIDFSKSVMVGNTPSDMFFGRNAGMKTVFVRSTQVEPDESLFDISVSDLNELTKKLGC